MSRSSPYSAFAETGIHRNQQIYALENVQVKGTIPEWLTGSYIRNGPGIYHPGNQDMRHWFDGLGALHKFDIAGGKVKYQGCMIECNSYRKAAETGKLAYSEFATDPCRSIFRKIQSYCFPALPNMTDNPKINVARIAGKMMALGETPMQVEFDPETLRTVGIQEPVPGGFAYKTTAHPHFENDHAWNLVVQFGMFSHYRIYDVAQPGSKPLASVPVNKPAYLHGFGMSEKYFIIAAGPLVVTPIELLFWKRPYIENHRWRPNDGSGIWVIEKATGKLKATFETDAFFSFHHVNAYEEGEELVMDINAYDDATIVQQYYLDQLSRPDVNLPKGTLRRCRLNLRTKQHAWEQLSDACIELPRIDYTRFNTSSKQRFTYGVSLHPEQPSGFYNSLVKIDGRSGKHTYWRETGCYPGEPFFQASPGSLSDEQGILISVVLDTRAQNSFLLLLDAESLNEIARATLPHPVVYGFHGELFT